MQEHNLPMTANDTQEGGSPAQRLLPLLVCTQAFDKCHEAATRQLQDADTECVPLVSDHAITALAHASKVCCACHDGHVHGCASSGV